MRLWCVSVMDAVVIYQGPPSALRGLSLHMLEILPAESLQQIALNYDWNSSDEERHCA